MHDPEVEVGLESRLEEADRDREYLRRQLAKYSEALAEIQDLTSGFGLDMDHMQAIERLAKIAQAVDRAVWTKAGSGER